MTHAQVGVAFCTWLASATGLAVGRIIYTPPAAPSTPEPPYIEAHFIVKGRAYGHDEVLVEDDQDILRGDRKDFIRVQVHGTGAIDYAESIRDYLFNPLGISQADELGLAILAIGESAPLDIDVDGQFVERAILECEVGYVRTKTLTVAQGGGTLEHVNLTADFGDAGTEVMTIDAP